MKKGKPRNYKGFESALNEIAMFYNFSKKVSFEELEDRHHIGRTLLPMCLEIGILVKEDKNKYRLVAPYSKELADNVYDLVLEKYRPQSKPKPTTVTISEEIYDLLNNLSELRKKAEQSENLLRRILIPNEIMEDPEL